MSHSDHDTPTSLIVRLVGVYDADSSLRGEVTYWISARLGRTHCSLCDITHGLARERRDWKVCRAGLPVRFDTYHRDDQPETIRVALDGMVPAVVAETEAGVVILVRPETLDGCAGSTDRLVTAIEQAVDSAGLRWPNPQCAGRRLTE